MKTDKSGKNIKFSIIVPVFKSEAYLDRCLQSVLQQGYANWEMILVDDGSPDNCGAICDTYAEQDERILVLHQKNQGQSSARNAGLEQVSGTYILFLDSDDYLEANALQILVNKLIQDDADIIWFNTYLCYADHKEKFLDLNAQEDFSVIFTKMISKYYGMFWAAWDKVYKASVFETIRFRPGVIYEDSLIFTEILAKTSNIVVLDDYLYNYYQDNAESTMRKAKENPWDDYKIFYVNKAWCEFLSTRNTNLYEIIVVQTLKKALRAYHINLAVHCLNSCEVAEIESFLLAMSMYANKLPLGSRVLYWGFRHCHLINSFKALEYKYKYRKHRK